MIKTSKTNLFSRLFFILISVLFISHNVISGQWNTPFKKTVLSNGIEVFFQNDSSSAVTVVQMLIHGAQNHISSEKAGLAYLSLRFLLEITNERQIQKIMDEASGLYLSTNPDHSILTVTSLSENIENTLKIASEIILNPVFSSIRINRLKKRMNAIRESEEDDPVYMAQLTHYKNFFGNHPYGFSPYGTKKSIKPLKKKDIKPLYESLISPKNLTLVITSDFPMEKIVEWCENSFKNIPTGKESLPAFPPNPSESKIQIDFFEKEVVQSTVSIGFGLPEITPKTLILATLLKHTMGTGIGSRLWPLRSEKKLAYNVNSRLSLMKQAGLIEFYLETDAEKLETAKESLWEIINNMHQKGMTNDELEMIKIFSKSTFLLDNESKEARGLTIATFLALGMDMDFINEYFSKIDSVSLEEMNSFIKTTLPSEKGKTVVIGPKKNPS